MIPMEWCKLIIVPFVLVITACTIDENNIASDTGTSLAIETDVETGIVVDTGDTDTTVSAELENIGSIEVTWDDLADNEEGFIIERSTAEDGDYKLIQFVSADSASYVDENVTVNSIDRTVCYRVGAYNQNGVSYSNASCHY